MTILADITPDFVSLNGGNFDTRFRYMRQVTTATPISVVAGPSVRLQASRRDIAYKNGPRSVGAVLPTNTAVNVDVGTNSVTPGGTALDLTAGGGIQIKNPLTGLLLFDGSLPMMHTLNRVEGFVDFPARNPSVSYDYSTDTVLGAIDASATHIVGSINTVYQAVQPSSTTGNASTDWWTVNGSCPLFHQSGEIGVGQAANEIVSNKYAGIVAWCHVDFNAVAGQLVMTERLSIFRVFNGGQFDPVANNNGSLNSYTRQAFRMNFKLRAVAFT